MATGTGTGTLATTASALTLNGLRDRIRTQLEQVTHEAWADALFIETSIEPASGSGDVDIVRLRYQRICNPYPRRRRAYPDAGRNSPLIIQGAAHCGIAQLPRPPQAPRVGRSSLGDVNRGLQACALRQTAAGDIG